MEIATFKVMAFNHLVLKSDMMELRQKRPHYYIWSLVHEELKLILYIEESYLGYLTDFISDAFS